MEKKATVTPASSPESQSPKSEDTAFSANTPPSWGIIAELGALPSGAIVNESALARMFGRCTTTMKRAVDRGELPPPIKMFGELRWTAGALLAHIEARLKAAREDAERERKRLENLSP
ncbi:MAG: hypothetical protein R6U36_08260 [Candidatus Fermentibacteraceae bacterium]